MTPQLAQAVDPIFLHVLDLLDRMAGNEPISAQDEQLRIRALLDQAEALVGSGPEWELIKYALVSWIDEMLVDTPWSGQQWWSNNVLEVALFNTRLCYEQFYLRAQEATTLSRRDALEVYYICVVLGFRGLYRDPEMAAYLIQAHGLPPDLETWSRQVALSIRLGQGRPPLGRPGPEIAGAPPLTSRALVVWSAVAAVGLGTWNLLYYALYYTRP